MMKALVVDDDLVLADVVSFTLRRAGFEVVLAHDGISALERFQHEQPSLVILDLQLPGKDGLEVCKTIRARSDTPIIMLTVRDTDADIIQGLGLGADDYITKPFSPAQLLARAQAVMRRSGKVLQLTKLTFADLTLNPERHVLELPDQPPTSLTQLEYKLMEALIANSEQVLPANTLIDRVWGPGGGDRAMLKQLVYRLRRKIEPEEGAGSIYIEAIPGIGYALMRR
ncbi:MAG: response regulator transcription factor [Armatimonadetes bacterium]|nr:response regulator transcription factor [Anaerolineae bacterium]